MIGSGYDFWSTWRIVFGVLTNRRYTFWVILICGGGSVTGDMVSVPLSPDGVLAGVTGSSSSSFFDCFFFIFLSFSFDFFYRFRSSSVIFPGSNIMNWFHKNI